MNRQRIAVSLITLIIIVSFWSCGKSAVKKEEILKLADMAITDVQNRKITDKFWEKLDFPMDKSFNIAEASGAKMENGQLTVDTNLNNLPSAEELNRLQEVQKNAVQMATKYYLDTCVVLDQHYAPMIEILSGKKMSGSTEKVDVDVAATTVTVDPEYYKEVIELLPEEWKERHIQFMQMRQFHPLQMTLKDTLGEVQTEMNKCLDEYTGFFENIKKDLTGS